MGAGSSAAFLVVGDDSWSVGVSWYEIFSIVKLFCIMTHWKINGGGVSRYAPFALLSTIRWCWRFNSQKYRVEKL